MYNINNKKVLKVKATTIIKANNNLDYKASCLLYYITNGKCTDSVCAKQFVCKTSTEINYNIFIINTTNNNLNSVTLLDILPKGASNAIIMIDGDDYDHPLPIDNEIEFVIDKPVNAHSYLRVIVTIDNNINIDIGSNTVDIVEVT